MFSLVDSFLNFKVTEKGKLRAEKKEIINIFWVESIVVSFISQRYSVLDISE